MISFYLTLLYTILILNLGVRNMVRNFTKYFNQRDNKKLIFRTAIFLLKSVVGLVIRQLKCKYTGYLIKLGVSKLLGILTQENGGLYVSEKNV